MSRSKGLSFDEKKKRLLELFWERKEVFALKELEPLAHKQKGIVQQSVKDVLKSLTDEGSVDQDKIGAGNFFWSYPSKGFRRRDNRLTELQSQITNVRQKIEQLKQSKKRAAETRVPSSTRTTKLQKLDSLKKKGTELDGEIGQYAISDPEKIAELEKGEKKCKEAANRWTDNIAQLQSVVRDRGVEDIGAFFKRFGIPADLEAVE